MSSSPPGDDALVEAVAPSRRKSWLALGLTLPLAALFLFLAFRGVAWGQMLDTVRRGHPQYLGLGLLGFTVSLSLRSQRWRVLLSAAKPIPRPTVFFATAIGYLGNNFLPARAGEVIRSVVIGRATGTSVSFVLATTLTERVMDAITLVLIGAAALTTVHSMPPQVAAAARGTGLVGLVGIAFVVLAPRMEEFFKSLYVRLHLPGREKLIPLLEQFLLGIRALQNMGRASSFIAYSGVIWLTDTVIAMVVARAFELQLTPPQALLLLAAIGLGSAVPSTPGYVGVYQFIAVAILTPLGFSRSQALVFIIAYQGAVYTIVLLWGSLGLLRFGAGSEWLTRHRVPAAVERLDKR